MNRCLVACILLLAASFPASGRVSAAGPAPAPTGPASASAMAQAGTGLPLQEKLTAVASSERGEKPAYTLETSTPVLEGTGIQHAKTFNRLAAALVQELVDEFKSGLAELSDSPQMAGSFYEATFEQLAPPGDIISIRFGVDGYFDGAAHPFHRTRTLNFSMKSGRELNLDMLFRPGCDHLAFIAGFCTAELAGRDIGFEPGSTGGADPRPENYANWNLTPEGLLITFDEYQVAAYVFGPQQVLVPFDALTDCLAEDFLLLTP